MKHQILNKTKLTEQEVIDCILRSDPNYNGFIIIDDIKYTELPHSVVHDIEYHFQQKPDYLEYPQKTESLRYNSGKTQLREIDPQFILGMGEVLTKSREKYPAFNWCLPTKLSTPMDSLERHWLAFKSGQDIDPDDGLHHLYKVAVNVMFIMYHLNNNKDESDDRGFKK